MRKKASSRISEFNAPNYLWDCQLISLISMRGVLVATVEVVEIRATIQIFQKKGESDRLFRVIIMITSTGDLKGEKEGVF